MIVGSRTINRNILGMPYTPHDAIVGAKVAINSKMTLLNPLVPTHRGLGAYVYQMHLYMCAQITKCVIHLCPKNQGPKTKNTEPTKEQEPMIKIPGQSTKIQELGQYHERINE